MGNKIDIFIKKLSPNAVIPTYAHDGDVGMDLTAISVEYDSERDMYLYHTGLSIESERHYGTFLFPRSSNRKTDAYLCNHVGIVDSAIYRGEIILCFKNRDSLRSLAEQAMVNEFIDNFTCGISAEDSNVYARRAWDKIMNNPMDFAPYNVGDRVAQMVVLDYPNVNLIEKDELSESERGTNGFGSSGN